MKRIFITFEGIEGCGKSTQSRLLKEFLENSNVPVMHTREPGGPKISEAIRTILLSNENAEMVPETELLLYMASRSQHTAQWIIPALDEGKLVISDRYYDSTLAYQGAARNLDRSIIDVITKFATYGLVPNLTILIDLPATKGLSRIHKDDADRLESESMDFHRRVRDGFLDLANSEKERYLIVDGTGSIDEIHSQIISAVKSRFLS